MGDQELGIVALVTILVLSIFIIRGAIKTFRRNWVVALLLLILFSPIWIIWAVVEIFTGPISTPLESNAKSTQNINVTVMNNRGEEEQTLGEFETKTKSSTTAKASLLMGAAALVKTSKPTKTPQAMARNGNVRNLNCHHKSKNKWVVTYETLHSSSGWIPEKKEISPGISGFSTWGGTVDIRWH